VTSSSDFPVSSGAFAKQNSGGLDAFAIKLNSSGAVMYSTYLGGSGDDQGLAIAVDTAGFAYIAGQTASVSYPVTSAALQRSYAGGPSDCFVSKVSQAGDSLVYSTFLGGNSLDLCKGVAVDSSGNAYVAGTTYSTNFSDANRHPGTRRSRRRICGEAEQFRFRTPVFDTVRRIQCR